MRKNKAVRLAGLCAAFAAVFVPAASARLTGQKYEKVCPITFRLYPGTHFEASCAAKIEKDNAKLATFLSDLRSNKKLRAWIESWIKGSERTGADALTRATSAFHADLEKEGYPDPFVGTYLADPKLTTEKGVIVEGLRPVIAELIRIVSGSTYLDVQSVHVGLEYLPYGSAAYAAKNEGIADPGQQIDIIAHIKTVLAYAPYDDPVTIEGTLPHRKVCFDY
jgi:hypothetical protein